MGDTNRTVPARAPVGLDGLDDLDQTDSPGTSGTPSGDGVRRGAGLGSSGTVRRLLENDALGFTEDDARGTTRRIQPNPAGLKKGYDPYDSGMLLKKQWKKKKDLRALSSWIQQKKRRGEEA